MVLPNKEAPGKKLKHAHLAVVKTSNPKDVMALKGKNAKMKGFGIGLGLDAVTIDGDGQVTKVG
jgi:hypothetical protein